MRACAFEFDCLLYHVILLVDWNLKMVLLTNSKREDIAGCFTLMLFFLTCGCPRYVFLPHGVIGWSAVCDCGTFWSYSLALRPTIRPLAQLNTSVWVLIKDVSAQFSIGPDKEVLFA